MTNLNEAPKLAKTRRPDDMDVEDADMPQGKQISENGQVDSDVEEAHRPITDAPDATLTKPSGSRIMIDDSAKPPREDSTLHIPGPRERDQGILYCLFLACPFTDSFLGVPLTELGHDGKILADGQCYQPVKTRQCSHRVPSDLAINEDPGSRPSTYDVRRRYTATSRHSLSKQADGVGHVARSMLILDTEGSRRRDSQSSKIRSKKRPLDPHDALELSRHATLGRNSSFHGLTPEDWERIGGIEYRSLRLLLKIVFGKTAPLIPSTANLSSLTIFQRTSSVSTYSVPFVSWVGFNMPTPNIESYFPASANIRTGGTF